MRHWNSPFLFGMVACIVPSVIALDPFGSNFFFDVPPIGEQGRIPSISDKEYYDKLGLDPGANEAAIKHSYRKLAVKNHPDKGGDPNKFKELAEAYDVLSNPKKRRAYDMYGKAGVETGAAGFPTNAEDILSAMFGAMGGGGRGRKYSYGSMRARDQFYEVEVPLTSMYTGANQKIRVALSQTDGQIYRDVNLKIPRGAQSGTRVVIPGIIDPGIANIMPGDLIFILKESPGSGIQRFGDHLLMDVKISLAEALTGFERQLDLMDGSEASVKLKEKDIISPGCLRRIRGKGMPNEERPEQTGDLYLRFEVVFPTTKELDELGENWRDELKTLLAYGGSDGQQRLAKTFPMDPKLGGGGKKTSSEEHRSPSEREAACLLLQPPDREFERNLRKIIRTEEKDGSTAMEVKGLDIVSHFLGCNRQNDAFC